VQAAVGGVVQPPSSHSRDEGAHGAGNFRRKEMAEQKAQQLFEENQELKKQNKKLKMRNKELEDQEKKSRDYNEQITQENDELRNKLKDCESSRLKG
jgi:DNA anti-recombination protein RmuC